METYSSINDGISDNKKKAKRYKHISQLQFIAVGFFLIIAVGTILLMLPIASRTGTSTDFLSALFTATSATCVTGLVVVDTCTHFSLFGQLVILILIQIGGLGFITLGVFVAIILRRKIGLRTRGLMSESANTLQIGGVVRLAGKIIKGTVFFEVLGAILLSIRFIPDYGLAKGIWYGIFHSVSAFCNAGFDLMGVKYGEYASLVQYQDDYIVNIVIMSLIVIGGIGFIVWDDIWKCKLKFKHYRLHTKIVLMVTAVLIFGGAALFYILESGGLMADMSMRGKVLSSLFQSVTARTAGFNTLDTSQLSQGSKLLTTILMFIGGSPGSTAGGIKTTTLFVLLMYVKSNIKRTYGVNAFGRRLDDENIKVASSMLTINLGMVLVASMGILITQQISMTDVLFETVSAIGTVGMSTGITRILTPASRVIIILLMYLGRVGSMSFALAFTQNKKIAHISLPVEGIRVG